MKNTVLLFITGMALGSTSMGLGLVNLNNLLALALIIPGVLWLVPFVYTNRKHRMIRWMLE